MSVQEASSSQTPYGRYITSAGWFVLNLADALAVRNDEKGAAMYPLESRDAPFEDFGVNVTPLLAGAVSGLLGSVDARYGGQAGYSRVLYKSKTSTTVGEIGFREADAQPVVAVIVQHQVAR